jgi:lipopolysaccharide/colanic/teichoic acid biosynthesis glycosyltransferase
MKLIILRESAGKDPQSGNGLVRFAFTSQPIATAILGQIDKSLFWAGGGKAVLAVPEGWDIKSVPEGFGLIRYGESSPVSLKTAAELGEDRRARRRCGPLVISDGRVGTRVNEELAGQVLSSLEAQVVAINVAPGLLGYREKVRLTCEGKVAGFRRLYSDCAEPEPVPADWPSHLFIRAEAAEKLLSQDELPVRFGDFVVACRAQGLKIAAVGVAGLVWDLAAPEGLLEFCKTAVDSLCCGRYGGDKPVSETSTASEGCDQRGPRLVGKVLLGKDVHIGPGAVIAGPSIVGDGARIEQGAVVRGVVIGPAARVQANQYIQNCIVTDRQDNAADGQVRSADAVPQPVDLRLGMAADSVFRIWPRFSYARCLKRIIDVVTAAVVLILFAPLLPFIVLVIKLNSPGSVFFRDKRQGLHGKIFNCLKFRTMAAGSDKIQQALRAVNEVDGPQFRIDDDPRVSSVGNFLRETHIDEIPQFLNVLLGQMSIVGPRPSPEVENTFCAYWRYARLSVRPGITGLWQVCRTRQPTKDFQEWIHYDTRYVKELSIRLDMWICWETAKKLVKNFFSQF